MDSTLLLWALGFMGFLFWILQIWSIVTMKDDDFPDHNDKLMWAIIVLFGFILGAVLFVLWKHHRSWEQESEQRVAAKMDRLLENEREKD